MGQALGLAAMRSLGFLQEKVFLWAEKADLAGLQGLC